MSTQRVILITGATGKQGGAVLRRLLEAQPNPPFSILAATRNTSSPSAKKLASLPNVSLVQGDLSSNSAVFKSAASPIWGVFGLTMPGKNEEADGKALVDTAVENGVKHFVFTSVNRGGNNEDPTEVPHFATKHWIEEHLKQKAEESKQGMTWTVLRPVAFMDMYTDNFFGRTFAALWRQMGEKKLQIVATEDIGFWGAKAFVDSESDEMKNKGIDLAGDDLTYGEAAHIFQNVTGNAMPVTYGAVATGIKWGVKEMGKMFGWFERVGYNVDVDALRKKQPGLKDWETWLRESSQFKGQVKT